MRGSGDRNTASNFDFSRPPPGYNAQHVSESRNYQSSHHARNTPDYFSVVSKIEQGARNPEPPRSNDSRFSYYQGSNLESNSSLQVRRPPSQETIYQAPLPPGPPETSIAVDPRMFGIPPPPPPTDPYPTNVGIPAAGYILNSTLYRFAAPPPGVGSIGAGHYLSQQHGNIRQPQHQGEYFAGYPKRNGFNNHLNRKRNIASEYESEGGKKGSAKKKKKPLSQNMPSKKDWSVEDAKRALDVEREFNKRHKSPSLIIKFPDLELNRDIVSKFHSKIESVHFQQPSTPRFCFVTLKDSSCMDDVIKDLCKIKFGDGYLTAEPKNNREEDLVKGPEDIDPLTLYVGNLAQEVTVDDVVKAYPTHKRIDIGFAKKMKYTRYAFVSFRTVDDAIEAFQRTHATEMYNKSLIVRFRRLHGTVGLPGDPKPQNLQRRNDNEINLMNDLTPSSYEKTHKIKELISDTIETNYLESSETGTVYLNHLRTLFDHEDAYSDVHVKDEPTDYDTETDMGSPEPHTVEENLHIPLVAVKSEPDVKPPIEIKQEVQEVQGIQGNVSVKKEPTSHNDASERSNNDKRVSGYLDDPFSSNSPF